MFINIYNLFTLLKGFKSFASYLENWINLIKKDKKENNLDFYNEILMMEGFKRLLEMANKLGNTNILLNNIDNDNDNDKR